MREESRLRTAFLISGGGTTAEAVIKACHSGELKGIAPVAVIASKPGIPGIEKAQALGVNTLVIPKYPDKATFGKRLLQTLHNLHVDLVSQNGWLPQTPEEVIMAYGSMIINQHPGPLDPDHGADFGGQGMYGARVTAAVLAYTWALNMENPYTESTVHHVSPEVDRGNLISVNRVELSGFRESVTIAQLPSDPSRLIEATEEVRHMLLPIEHKNVIGVLQNFTDGTVPVYRRTCRLIPQENMPLLNEAKRLGQQLFPDG